MVKQLKMGSNENFTEKISSRGAGEFRKELSSEKCNGNGNTEISKIVSRDPWDHRRKLRNGGYPY